MDDTPEGAIAIDEGFCRATVRGHHAANEDAVRAGIDMLVSFTFEHGCGVPHQWQTRGTLEPGVISEIERPAGARPPGECLRIGPVLGTEQIHGEKTIAVECCHCGTLPVDADQHQRRFGIGTDIAITENLFGRLEYIHTWLSEERYSYCSVCSADIKLGQNSFRLGLGYRF